MTAASAPIGVFDSGIGGLTVMREIAAVLPGEGVAYLGDTARVPYGIRSPGTVRRYAREGASFLMQRGIKLLVVACNTMSAVGLDGMDTGTDIPVIGVILPGARAAAEATQNGRVGVIGTEATVRSRAYGEAIRSVGPSVEVFSAACPLFVPLVEEGWLEGEVPRLVAKRYLHDLRDRGIDTLVLGCTHYPLLKPMLSEVLGPGITLIDSAEETAKEVRETLSRRGMLEGSGEAGGREFFVTDSPEKFTEVGGRFLGAGIDTIEKVELEVCA
jgi:glutamate racemase